MNDFEHRVSTAFHTAAEDVAQVHGLAEAARARRRRRQSARLSVAACAAVAAIVIPAAILLARDSDVAPGRHSAVSDATSPTTTSAVEPECDALTAAPPLRPAPIREVPDPQARFVAVNETGAIVAWFNLSGTLPELTVFDLAADRRLAWEDLGVGEVVSPSMRIIGDAVYYRTAVDPDEWMRYRWSTDSYPAFYRTCVQAPGS